MYVITIALFLFSPFLAFSKASRTYILHSPEYGQGAGLFHNFHIVVGLLDFYENNPSIGLIVDFEDKGLYYEPSHGLNWWNYYFEPINLESLEDRGRKPIAKVLESTEKAYFGNNTLYYFSRERVSELIKRYIKINRVIEDEVHLFRKRYLDGNYVIGVHYRNTDKQTEAPHVSIQTLTEEIQNQIKLAPSNRIKVFLATDDVEAKDFLINTFKDILVFQNAFYSSGQVGAHFVHRGYESGKSAVIDSILLSKCDVLIRTSSNLSAASAFMNPNLRIINLNSIFTHLIPQINLSKLNEINKTTIREKQPLGST